MPTITKIKIVDNVQLREEIDSLYDQTNQIILAKWSVSIAKHILDMVGIDYNALSEIIEGFKIIELWQLGEASMHDVRQKAFKIHKLARETDNEIKKTALRVTGQAVGSGHMREHSMIASDYAIKVVGLIYSSNIDDITRERIWQLDELKKFMIHKKEKKS